MISAKTSLACLPEIVPSATSWTIRASLRGVTLEPHAGIP